MSYDQVFAEYFSNEFHSAANLMIGLEGFIPAGNAIHEVLPQFGTIGRRRHGSHLCAEIFRIMGSKNTCSQVNRPIWRVQEERVSVKILNGDFQIGPRFGERRRDATGFPATKHERSICLRSFGQGFCPFRLPFVVIFKRRIFIFLCLLKHFSCFLKLPVS